MAITSKQKETNAHYSMIHHCLCVLPLDAVRLLYKYILAVFVQTAVKAQSSASNVGADLPTEVMDEADYLIALARLGDSWERAAKKSKPAFHYLRLLDDAIIVGKMRAGVAKCAYGSFEQAIAAVDSGNGASGGPNYSSLISLSVKKSAEKKEVLPESLDAVPTERMGTYVCPSLPVVLEDTEPAPAVVHNYLVF